MLCEMLDLMWSYISCTSCACVWVVVNDWEMGQIAMGGGFNGGSIYVSFFL